MRWATPSRWATRSASSPADAARRPDLECMREVGILVCPADAAAEVIEASRYVSEFRGGEGAVRDIVEQVLRARGDWAKNSEGVTPSSLAASR